MATINKGIPAGNFRRNFAWLLLALSGLSFLFFVGFPFDNHNESYGWLIFFDRMGFTDILTTRIDPVQSFRPLGTATAWLSYKVSHDIYLQQLINWFFAAASFALLFYQAPHKPAFSLAAFLGTTAFFAGYIYLFHLHGVFYGPMQLYIAVLVVLAVRHRALSTKNLLLLFAASVLVALFHTFALIVFIAFLAGTALHLKRSERLKRLPVLLLLIAATAYVIYFIISIYRTNPSGDLLHGALTSYHTTELNMAVRLVAALFAVYTAATTNLNSTVRLFYIIATVLAILAFAWLKIPVLLVWIVACVVKSIAARNWILAAIIGATAVFPVPTHTGTPTYVVFVIMVCLFVTPMHRHTTSATPAFFAKGIALLLVLLLATAIALKQGVHLPLVARITQPILAEQEKTQQMRTIIAWRNTHAPYNQQYLRLFDKNENPSFSKDAINRKNRPPAKQFFLDYYMYKRYPTAADTSVPALFVTFGNKKLPGQKPRFAVPGTWNGWAYVY